MSSRRPDSVEQSSASYDVTADGQRFLMVRDDDVTVSTRIVVVLNFAEEVRAKDRGRLQAATK
jgi:hypothetical protein